jgi:hypothetical protein
MPAVRLSRYEFANVFKDEKGRLFLDVPDPTSKDVLLRGASRRAARAVDTLWSLAWAEYQALLDREQDIRPTSFFDVVGLANDIVDPVAPIADGKVVLLPSAEVILGDVRIPPPFVPTTAANPGSA